MRLAESIIFPRVPCSEFHLNRYKRFICSLYNKRSFLSHHKRTKGYERHHIIPKGFPFKGSDEDDNFVLLTPREHYIAHLLIVYAFPDYRDHTLACFKHFNNKVVINSKTYEKVRTGYKLSEQHKRRISEGNKGVTRKRKKPMSDDERERRVNQARINGSCETAKAKLREINKGKKPSQNTIDASIEHHKKHFTKGGNPKAIPEIWDNYEQIKKVWLDNNKCGVKKLYRLCGFGNSPSSYCSILKHFRRESDDDMI